MTDTQTIHRYVSWAEVEVHTMHLIQEIKRKEQHIHRIVAIEKGGLIPAAMILQAFPQAEFHTLRCTSYMKEGKREPTVETGKLYTLGRILDSATTLIVDEICDTGDTFALLRKILPKAKFAALFVREGTDNPPDFWGYAEPDDTWLNFPWEVFAPV